MSFSALRSRASAQARLILKRAIAITIRHADCIVVLKEGRIAEAGSHEELLKLNGLYRKLHDTQFDLNN